MAHIGEKVRLLALYECRPYGFMPKKIQWRGRVYIVRSLGYHHAFWEGRKLIHIFSVLTNTNISFRLRHDTETLLWVLEEVIDGSSP